MMMIAESTSELPDWLVFGDIEEQAGQAGPQTEHLLKQQETTVALIPGLTCEAGKSAVLPEIVLPAPSGVT